jgi:hypothetical protein
MKKSNGFSLLTGGMLLLLAGSVLSAPGFTPNSQPSGWLSTPVVTLFNVSSGEEHFYYLDFRKGSWRGDVIARDISSVARIETTGPWDNLDPTVTTAGALLDATDFNTGRKIATRNAAFRWGNLTADQKTALISENHLKFIRGDRSNEEPKGKSFRQRKSVLGDVMHSNIYFWDHGASQSLYVGANDGMLHAFDASTGAENWAYIPSMVIPNLALLAAKPYVHTYFVDGPISIANVDDSGTTRTILVGALGAGGKGLYALDISNPTAADEAGVAGKALWEITASGSFANLGYTYGTPLITRLNNGTPVVIFGNGYVNSGNGHAVLYIVHALTGALISAIDTGSGSLDSPNGLSSPTLYDADQDPTKPGRPEYVYAGDIDGNLWKFDLSDYSSSLVFTTNPVQAITTAPVVHEHPLGGPMVVFATGRILTTGDKLDDSEHYVYGIWDEAPGNNDTLLEQTLTASTHGAMDVRTVSGNVPDWTDGSGNHFGWKVALQAGERVVGEKPFYNNGRIYFLATNPTMGTGANWLHELLFMTGGSPLWPIFDLNEDGEFTSADLADNGGVPVAKFLGSGVYSQPRLVDGAGLTTTLYSFHPDLPIIDDIPTDPDDPGVSGGHFDFDIYYPVLSSARTQTVIRPNNDDVELVHNYCAKSSDVDKKLDGEFQGCTENASAGYDYLTDFDTGAECDGKDTYYQTLHCNTVTVSEETRAPYKKWKHVHEYDDKFDVTGVNMLNASLTDFNLVNAIPDTNTEFKVLVMNQYLNPAAQLSVGGADFESVKTYGGLASTNDPAEVLANQRTYTRASVNTLIYNLPLDAFKSKDWWGDGSVVRAGLIPTQTGCVNGVDTDGVVNTPGKHGERYNGALTIQLIKPDTPAGKIEKAGPDLSYGWRVKTEDHTQYVLAEYTSFWHHPNGKCYDDDDWVPDPPQDFDSNGGGGDPAPGSADPRNGQFGTAIVATETTVSNDGSVTTTKATYVDGTEWLKIVTVNADGTVTVYQKFRDETEETVTYYKEGGEASFTDPNTGSPIELMNPDEGRQTWVERY